MKARVLLFLQVGAIILAGWFVYSPAIHGAWLWDDPGDISKHPALRDPAGLGKIWTAPDGPDYFPLTTSFQRLEWHWWGADPLGYHLANVGFHLLSALLFWRLLRKLGVPLAWFGGIVFAVHPLAVESVAWVAELKNTLSLALLLAAAGAYIEFDSSGSRRAYALSIAGFLAAMLAKTSVVMFPGVILLHAWWKRGRIAGSDLRASAGFFAISLILGAVTLRFQETRAMGGFTASLGGALARMEAAGLAAAFYLGKCAWPAGLLPVYPRWQVEPIDLASFLPWLGFAVLIGVCWARRATWGRHALFGLGFLLLNLAPVLGFLPMAYLRISRVADHFAYLPLLGVAGLAAAALGLIRSPALRWAGAAAVAAVLACAGRAHARLFESPATLWSYTVERNPGAWVADNNLASELLRRGRIEEAILRCKEALRLMPDYPEALNTLGNACVAAGRLPEGIAAYERAVRIEPGYAEVRANLGAALARAGRLAEAIPQLEEALRLKPGVAQAQLDLGSALASGGRMDEAIARYRQALAIDPEYAEAHFNLANALADTGRLDQAIAHYREALRLAPGNAAAHANLGIVLRAAGRGPEDAAKFEEAQRLDPGR